MLTPLDDYPIHQIPQPVAHPATGDLNHYDRYFFNGYDRDGEVFFAAAMGLYPNRHVIDAAFSVVSGDVQRSAFASGRIPADRRATEVGPIRVEVVEPLRRLRLVVDDPDGGLAADVTFTARTPVVEEPRMTQLTGTQLRQDYTRLTQWGAWEGSLRSGDTAVACEPATVLGSRDRSWGIRRVGEQPPGAPGPPPQFFWLWAPVHFDDHCVHLALNDDAEGRHWYESAVRVPVLDGPTAPTWGPDVGVDAFRCSDHDIDWEPGTRRARRARLRLVPWRGEPVELVLEPRLTFQMRGIGYLHPEWGHGRWVGESATGRAEWTLAELDPLEPGNLHVQQLCRVDHGGRQGVGVLEQLVIGPHEPSGFAGALDGAAR
jgi:hypothetical protein